MRLRIGVGALGVLLGLFGAFRLLTEIDASDLVMLILWLVAALVLHDGILSPLVAGTGYAMGQILPARARRYLQPALIVGALIAAIAAPMIYLEGSQPKSKAILQQNYGGNLALVLGIIAVLAVAAYLIGITRARTVESPSTTKVRPPDDQSASNA